MPRQIDGAGGNRVDHRGAGIDASIDRSRSIVGKPTGLQKTAGQAADGVLLTGATGFVGMVLLARYLERTDRRIYTLIRGRDDREVAARLQRTLCSLFGADHPYAGRVVAVRGDITHRGLGLPGNGEDLAEQVSEIVHGAASVSFDLGLEASRTINVDGTRRMLAFGELCNRRDGLRRFSYISTAFVAGEHAGCFSEDELEVGQSFRNSYEQSKFEAERLVTSARARLPVTVFRPSIIVGEQDSGWTSSFNVLYWPLRAFAHGAYLALPGRSKAPVDVVPVDYVADAVFALSQAPEAEGSTYHLTAGAHASSVGELVDLATARFERPAPRLITPFLYRNLVHPVLVQARRDQRQRRALARSKVFFPYFATSVEYDDRCSRVALGAAGIKPPPLHHYFDRLVEFALAADWGRRPIARASVTPRALPPSVGRAAEAPAARARLVSVG